MVKHSAYLDGIRGLAVAVVVLFHFNSLLNAGLGKVSPLLLIGRLFLCGWLGVDIFFVLSGFLITGIILRERTETNFWNSFYLRRALRILPAFLVVLTSTLLATHFLLPTIKIMPSSVIMSIFFMANWTIVNHAELPLLGHLWSLAVEEQFYFLWPQAVTRLSASGVLKLSAMLAVLCEFLRIGLALAHTNAYVLYKITPTSIDGLAIGAALAASMTKPTCKQLLARNWSTIAFAAGVLLQPPSSCFAAASLSLMCGPRLLPYLGLPFSLPC